MKPMWAVAAIVVGVKNSPISFSFFFFFFLSFFTSIIKNIYSSYYVKVMWFTKFH